MRYDKQDILARTDFESLYSEIIPGFKKIGAVQALGRCQFHEPDKNPSMSLNLERRGLFHCFACGAKGDAFDLCARVWHMGFKDTLAELAKRAGVSHD